MERLLCIVGSMNAGGAETFLMKLYRQLDKTRYQMDFAVAISEEGAYDKEIRSLGGRIYHISPKSAGLIKNFTDIKRVVKENNYKSVLRVSQHSLSALELFAAQLGGSKTRIFRSSNSNTTNGSSKSVMLHKLCKFMPRLFANVRIAPSTEAAEFMFGKNSINNGKAQLLHNAVDLSVYKFSETDRIAIRSEFGCEDKYVLGHVGRFSQQKNHEYLIDIFYELSKRHENAVLMLVGKGELEEKIRKKVENYGLTDKVIFTGVRSDVPKLMSAMDVFVFPSFYEGMPNTVIEAQACGLHCVVADTITKEANITGLVEYLDLNVDAKMWVSKIEQLDSKHINTKSDFIAHKYDISTVTNEFTKLVFKNQK